MDHGVNTENSVIACFKAENWEHIDWLLKYGASANVSLPQGFAPLSLAVYEGDIERVQWWTQRGADVNFTEGNGPLIKFKGWSPLMVAIFSDKVEAPATMEIITLTLNNRFCGDSSTFGMMQRVKSSCDSNTRSCLTNAHIAV